MSNGNGYPPNRRNSDTSIGDTARILAIMYTLGYFTMVLSLMYTDVPRGNEGIINTLIGILSVIQTSVIGYYFGGSKSAETSQKASIESRAKSDEALQIIAKSVPEVLPNLVPPPSKGL